MTEAVTEKSETTSAPVRIAACRAAERAAVAPHTAVCGQPPPVAVTAEVSGNQSVPSSQCWKGVVRWQGLPQVASAPRVPSGCGVPGGLLCGGVCMHLPAFFSAAALTVPWVHVAVRGAGIQAS